jgi:hypothetical protein
MRDVAQSAGDTWTIDATVGTSGPFWDVLRAMDLSRAVTSLTSAAARSRKSLDTRICWCAPRVENSRLEVEDGVAHLVIRKVK